MRLRPEQRQLLRLLAADPVARDLAATLATAVLAPLVAALGTTALVVALALTLR